MIKKHMLLNANNGAYAGHLMMSDRRKITLNIFSNCSEVDVTKIPIKETIDSFFGCFSGNAVHKTNVLIDKSPFQRSYDRLRDYVSDFYKDYGDAFVHFSYGLASGYKKSVVLSETEYAFQLEHDWKFKKELIRHSIPVLIDMMAEAGVEHLRFNKGENIEGCCDTKLEEIEINSFKLCRTPCSSNNPHLIHVPTYLQKYLHLIDTSRLGSRGVEENLWGATNSCIYGPLGYPATIEHNDGRPRLRWLGKKLGRSGFNFLIRNGWLESALEAEYYLRQKFHRA